MEKNEIERYDFFVSVYKTENNDYEYMIGQEFVNEDGIEEVEFIERGSAQTLDDAADLAAEGVRSTFR